MRSRQAVMLIEGVGLPRNLLENAWLMQKTCRCCSLHISIKTMVIYRAIDMQRGRCHHGKGKNEATENLGYDKFCWTIPPFVYYIIGEVIFFRRQIDRDELLWYSLRKIQAECSRYTYKGSKRNVTMKSILYIIFYIEIKMLKSCIWSTIFSKIFIQLIHVTKKSFCKSMYRWLLYVVYIIFINSHKKRIVFFAIFPLPFPMDFTQVNKWITFLKN